MRLNLFFRVLNFNYIVTFIGSTVLPSQPLCIVMEYVKGIILHIFQLKIIGGSLSNLLQKPLSEKLKCKLAVDVARGNDFAMT